MSNRLTNLLWLVVVILFCYIFSRAQNPPTQSWLLWSQSVNAPGSEPVENAYLYKIQDGSCSLYLAYGGPSWLGNPPSVAIAAGQGCSSYPTITLDPNGTATSGGFIINKPVGVISNKSTASSPK
jgi:hypothetical protein